MTLVVFGGTGFVGSSIIKKQINKEKIFSISSNKVRMYDSKSIKLLQNTQFKSYLKKEKKFDAIFCASTRYDPKKYSTDPLGVFKNNINSIIKFLKILDKKNIRKVLLISSYAVYGKKNNKNKESSKILIENFSNKEFYYALAKFIQENLLGNFCKAKKINYNIIRLPSLYGPGSTLKMKNSHVIPSFIMQVLNKKKSMKVYGNGNEKREFVYIFDLIKILMKLRNNNVNGIINVGTNKFVSIKNILDIIIKSTNSNIIAKKNNISFSDVPLRKVNYSKFKKNIKNFNFEKISSGLLKTINWYKSKNHD